MFVRLAKKINLFNRDRSTITKSDVAITYSFIFIVMYLISWFSVKYYQKGQEHIALCHATKFACVKAEIIRLIVPFTGIVYGFICTAYKGCDLLASGINYFCCCVNCCNKNNENNIDIELNDISNNSAVIV